MPELRYRIDYTTYREYEMTIGGHDKWWGIVEHSNHLGYTTFWGPRVAGRQPHTKKSAQTLHNRRYIKS